MIRVLQKADIERVVDIWLDTNLKAHNFIPGQYWKNNIDLVKETKLFYKTFLHYDLSDAEAQRIIAGEGPQ